MPFLRRGPTLQRRPTCPYEGRVAEWFKAAVLKTYFGRSG